MPCPSNIMPSSLPLGHLSGSLGPRSIGSVHHPSVSTSIVISYADTGTCRSGTEKARPQADEASSASVWSWPLTPPLHKQGVPSSPAHIETARPRRHCPSAETTTYLKRCPPHGRRGRCVSRISYRRPCCLFLPSQSSR